MLAKLVAWYLSVSITVLLLLTKLLVVHPELDTAVTAIGQKSGNRLPQRLVKVAGPA
jgi:hypothetical protein